MMEKELVIICPVGTSIIENFFEKNEQNREIDIESFRRIFSKIREFEKENKVTINGKKYDKNFITEKLEKESGEIAGKEFLKFINQIEKWIESSVRRGEYKPISAEIKSCFGIMKSEKCSYMKIHLIQSDTIIGALSAHFVDKAFELLKEKEGFEIETKIESVEGIQPWDGTKFRKGIGVLVSTIMNIQKNMENFGKEIVVNVTGGFKGLIPYLVLFSQLEKFRIAYIFEDSEELIWIPWIKVLSKDYFSTDEREKIKKFVNLMKELSGNNTVSKFELLGRDDFKLFEKEYGYLLEMVGEYEEELVTLNPFGEHILKLIENSVFEVFITEKNLNQIRNDERLRRVFVKFLENKENKTEIKNDWPVYDDGNNPYRIIYFTEKSDLNEKLYVYKVFNDHDDYERELDKQASKEVKKELENSKYLIFVSEDKNNFDYKKI